MHRTLGSEAASKLAGSKRPLRCRTPERASPANVQTQGHPGAADGRASVLLVNTWGLPNTYPRLAYQLARSRLLLPSFAIDELAAQLPETTQFG